MSDANGFVDRPEYAKPGRKTGWRDPKYAALCATAENGKALRFPVTTDVNTTQNALRQVLKRRGLRFHYTNTGDGFITAWASKPAGPDSALASAERSEDAS